MLELMFGSLNDVVQKKPAIPLPDEWELPKEEFSVGEVLGKGYFSTVRRGCWRNFISVAIKILNNGAYEFVHV